MLLDEILEKFEMVADDKTKVIHLDDWTFYDNGKVSWVQKYTNNVYTVVEYTDTMGVGFYACVSDSNWCSNKSKIIVEGKFDSLSTAMSWCDDIEKELKND